MLQRFPVLPEKLETSLHGIGRAAAGWLEWTSTSALANKRIWIHGASVGEALVAKPILARLRSSLLDPVTVIHTFTSPSVSSWSGDIGADRRDYLPAPHRIKDVLRAFQPDIILYPRSDLWPPMVTHAARLGIPQVVVGGTLSPHTSRLRWPPRSFYRKLLRQLSAVCAVSEDDVEVWRRLGVRSCTTHVTGDPRDDEILDGNNPEIPDALQVWADKHFVLVAGSTHRRDHRMIIEAVSGCAEEIRLLVIPHDPGSVACRDIEETVAQTHLEAAVWQPDGPPPPKDARLVVVHARGFLRALYGLGAAAYIGGGFERSGVHSMGEAAAWKIPIAVGPRAAMDADAQRFVRGGGAKVIQDAHQLRTYVTRWHSDTALRSDTGKRAKACLSGGAAQRTARIVVNALTTAGITGPE